MNLRGFFELVRIFLTPSAVADSLAGYSLAQMSRQPKVDAQLIAVAVASILLYWTGMATNDLFDLRKDRESQDGGGSGPGKPLVGGRISVRAAWITSVCLACGGMGAAYFANAILPAAAVLVAALAYNAGLKRIPLIGNLMMGSCRAGNFLLGAAAVVGTSTEALAEFFLPAGILGLFVTGITAISVLEDKEFRPAVFHAIATPMLAIPLALGILCEDSPAGWTNTIALLWLLIRTQRLAASRRLPVHPAAVYVRGSLSGIFLVDAGLIWTFSPLASTPWQGPAGLYALYFLSIVWKKRWLKAGRSDT